MGEEGLEWSLGADFSPVWRIGSAFGVIILLQIYYWFLLCCNSSFSDEISIT